MRCEPKDCLCDGSRECWMSRTRRSASRVRDVTPPPPPPPPPPPEPEPETEAPRRCSRCEQVLPASSFNRGRGGRQWWCRECFKAYFRARGDGHRKEVKKAKRRRRREGREFISRYLASNPCVDCGEDDPAVLEFDHLRDKRAAVSWLRVTGTGLAALGDEISKCEVVCVNCHRRRTARRANWWRLHPDEPPPPSVPAYQGGNVRYVYRVLRASACVDCGENDLVVLDFDHIGVKRDSVLRLAWGGWSRRTIEAEIAVCEVRCANCHRRRTKTVSESAA